MMRTMLGLLICVALCAGCGFQISVAPADSSEVSDGDVLTDVPGDITGGENGLPAGPPFVRRIDITDSQVINGPHAGFPVLLAGTAAWLRTTANGGRIANTNASDVWFSPDAAGTTTLPHEIERYDPTTGAFVAWVKVTSLQPTTAFFVHYGDPAHTTVLSPALVWTPGFAGVWHVGGPVNDASAQNAPATASGATTVNTGQVFEARDFDGNNDYIDLGSAAAVDDLFAGGGTVETWFYARSWGEASYGRLFDKGHFSGWSFGLNRVDSTVLESVFFVHGVTSGSHGHWNTPALSVTLNNWHHVAVVYDKGAPTNDAAIYLDGVAQQVTRIGTPTQTLIPDAPSTMYFGNRGGTDRTFDGYLDEARVSTDAKSAGWISTSYKNQRDPIAFSTFGPEL